jgi:hypothetical protein
MQIGKPPKNPEMMLANPNTFDYCYVSPKVPSPKYRFPLLSNYYRYRNCSKIKTTLITAAEGTNVINF